MRISFTGSEDRDLKLALFTSHFVAICQSAIHGKTSQERKTSVFTLPRKRRYRRIAKKVLLFSQKYRTIKPDA